MKLGYLKSIDQRVPLYTEECNYLNDMDKSANSRNYGRWKPPTFEWTKPSPSINHNKINVLQDSKLTF